MMTCPRCGFDQPEDRYCANCGLDVALHQAAPKPFLQRLLGNPVFYLLLAIAVFFGLVKYIKKTPLNPFRTGETIEATSPVTGGGGPTAANPVQRPRDRAEEKSKAQNFAPEGKVNEPLANTATNPENAAKAAEAPKLATQVEVSFFEVPRKSWLPLAAEGRVIFEQSAIRILSFANRDKIISLVGFSRRLPSSSTFSNQPSSTHQFLFSAGRVPENPRAAENPRGSESTRHMDPRSAQEPRPGEGPQALVLDFSVVKNDAGNVDLDLLLQLDLKHEGGSESHAKAATTVTLPTNGALALTQFLPHRPLPEAASPVIANSPLSVLDSADYIEGSSELIALINGK